MSDDAADRFEDALEDRAFGRRARRGGGGGRKKSGGASSSWSGRDTQISKALSRLLRHQAQAAGVPLDREGYARLDLVVSLLAGCLWRR